MHSCKRLITERFPKNCPLLCILILLPNSFVNSSETSLSSRDLSCAVHLHRTGVGEFRPIKTNFMLSDDNTSLPSVQTKRLISLTNTIISTQKHLDGLCTYIHFRPRIGENRLDVISYEILSQMSSYTSLFSLAVALYVGFNNRIKSS